MSNSSGPCEMEAPENSNVAVDEESEMVDPKSSNPSHEEGSGEVSAEKDIPNVAVPSTDDPSCSDQAAGLDSSEESLTKEGIQKLSHDLMDLFLPNLELAKESLHELTQNQKILIETVQQENAKFDECSSKEKLGEILSHAKKYHTKLLGIKKQMALLQEKSTKLKKRALRLQQQKQKEELQKAQQQEQDLEREQMLVAKVVTKQ